MLGLEEPDFFGVPKDAGGEASGEGGDAFDGGTDGSCTPSPCTSTAVVTNLGAVFDLAIDDTNVYFTSFDRWLLGRLDKTTGAIDMMLPEGGVQEPTGLALHDAHVYWSAYGAGNLNPSRNGMRRMPKAGGAAETIDACNTAFDIAVNDEFVFGVTSSCGGKPRVRRKPMSDLFDASAVDSELDDGPYSYAIYGYMGLDSKNVFWANASQVKTLPLDFGADASVLATSPGGDAGFFQALRVDDRVYALLADRLVAIDKTTGAVSPLAENLSAKGGRAGIFVFGTDVYFTQPKAGIVARVPKGGGVVTTIAVDQKTPSGIVVDAKNVYWANAGDGTIMRAAK